MKELTFNTNSLHFYLATKLGNYVPSYVHTYMDGYTKTYGSKPDICTYLNAVIRGGVKAIAIAAVIMVFGYVLSHMFLGIIFSLVRWEWFFTDIGIFGFIGCLFVCSVIVVLVICGLISHGIWALKQKIKNKNKNSDSFIKHSYQSWKDKFCVLVKFED